MARPLRVEFEDAIYHLRIICAAVATPGNGFSGTIVIVTGL
jgi:hypothetical protein